MIKIMLIVFVFFQQSTSLAGVPRTMAKVISALTSVRMMPAVMPHLSVAIMGVATHVSALSGKMMSLAT